MDYKTVFGGAAIVSILAFAWNQIKGFYRNILGLFVQTVTLPAMMTYTHTSVVLYMESHYKRFSGGLKNVAQTQYFIKKYNKEKHLIWHAIPRTDLIYFDGWKPILVTHKNPTAPQLIFLKKTFNYEKLLNDALSYKEQMDQVGYNRFFIKKIIQSSLVAEKGDNEKDNTQKSEANGSWFEFNPNIFKTINYNQNDIVIENNNQYLIDKIYLNEEKLNIVNELEFWLNNEEWYISRTIPWKRGYLLHGPPGTGKSCFVKAIAQKLSIPLYVMDLSTMDNYYIQTNYVDYIKQNTPCIVLYEDIDNVFDKRVNLQKREFNDDLTFDMFLNVIDGVETSSGVITIITTNDLEKVDDALKYRPGRIDRVIEFGNLDKAGKYNIAKRILDSTELIDRIILEDNEETTPAQFTEKCIRVALEQFHNNENRYN